MFFAPQIKLANKAKNEDIMRFKEINNKSKIQTEWSPYTANTPKNPAYPGFVYSPLVRGERMVYSIDPKSADSRWTNSGKAKNFAIRSSDVDTGWPPYYDPMNKGHRPGTIVGGNQVDGWTPLPKKWIYNGKPVTFYDASDASFKPNENPNKRPRIKYLDINAKNTPDASTQVNHQIANQAQGIN
jgi:hypothetical protein